MHRLFLLSGSLLGALGVMIGAFGAHALKSTLEANNRLDTFETAVKYQFYHALALLLLGFIMTQFEHRAFVWSGFGFLAGFVLFCGSLYILSVTGFTKMGMVAPFGGLAFIIGWLALFYGLTKAF